MNNSGHAVNLLGNDPFLRKEHKDVYVHGLSYACCADTYIFLNDTGYGSCSMKEEKEDDDIIILHIVDMNMND